MFAPIALTLLLAPPINSTKPVANATPPAHKKEIKAPSRPTPGSPAEVRWLLSRAPAAADYPSASKATLLDLADVTIRPDGSARTVTRMCKKIFNSVGRDEEAEVRIPYNGAFETVTIVRARTILPNGQIIPVAPADIRESKNPSGYDDVCLKSFSFPAVVNGAIVDYEYVTEQKASQMPGHYWSQWYFNSGRDPVMLTQLTVRVPKTLTLRSQLQNTEVQPQTSESDDGKSRVYVWTDRNVVPIELEEAMNPPIERLMPKLTYGTVPSWQVIADWYTSLAKDRATADAAIQQKVAELIKDKKTEEEKAKAIFYYVQEQTRYVAIELGTSAYQPRPAARTFANLYGDCKDMTTLLISMLRVAGITAYPVLLTIPASVDGVRSELPTPSAFNHAICLTEIGGKKFWLDATAQVCPWGEVPGADQGADAFVIRDGKGVFETIPVAMPEQAKNEQNLKIALNADGSAVGTLTLSGNGDYAMALRRSFLNVPAERVRAGLEAIARTISPNAKVSEYKLSDLKDKDAPVEVSMLVQFPTWAKQSGDLLLFTARPDQASGSYSSPFQEESRMLPVVQSATQLSRTVLSVTLPAGMTLVTTPANAKGESALGKYERTVTLEGNQLTLTLLVQDNRVEVPAADYPALRTYFAAYLKVLEESVLVKKQ